MFPDYIRAVAQDVGYLLEARSVLEQRVQEYGGSDARGHFLHRIS